MMRGMLVLLQKSADPAICHVKLPKGKQRREDALHRNNILQKGRKLKGVSRHSVYTQLTYAFLAL